MSRYLNISRVLAGVLVTSAILMVVASGEVGGQAPQVPTTAAMAAIPFETWLDGFRTVARTRGISARTIDEALDLDAPLPIIVARDRTQAELTLTLDQYLQRRISRRMVRDARAARTTHRRILARVARDTDVPAAVLVAVWGLESNFGRFAGVRPTVAVLATLAHEGRRAGLFTEELLAALRIIDSGEVPLAQLRGSWAGAMGQPQFMPSTYLNEAVDGDGDGRRDIWGTPADVFASIGGYLRKRGWSAGVRWGREIKIPKSVIAAVGADVPLRMTGACRAIRDLTEPRPMTHWRHLGVRTAGGAALPVSDVPVSLLRLDGKAFLVTGNYEALLGYNCAHTYALSVATLADRL